jgi:hypothetical protein
VKLCYRRDRELPALAWCASVDRTAGTVAVRHGELVEVHAGFFIEGAWSGPFEAGQFAATECVFGSGGSLSGEDIVFVASCSTTDALFYVERSQQVLASNSLPLLLAAIGDELEPAYPAYFELCESLIRGINGYEKTVVTRRGAVQRLLFRNLRVGRDGAREEDKPLPPLFGRYEEYAGYLERHYAQIVANARSARRRRPLRIYSTQSRGYDSTAINALAARHGIDGVFTSARSKSLDPFDEARGRGYQNDDGSEICGVLGLECTRIDRKSYEHDGFADEYLLYASQAANQDANLRGLHQHIEAPALVLTGVLGEIWYDEAGYAQWPGYVTDELKRFDVSGHGLSEARLRIGYVQLALPFLGAQRRADICRISNSAEMQAWRVNPGYDRPIPRRIAEERGVPRQLFGQVKMGSVVLFRQPARPHGRALRREFFNYLVANGVLARWQAWLWPAVQTLNSVLEVRSPQRFRAVYYLERCVARIWRRDFRFRPLWTRRNGLLFCFSVNKCVAEYGPPEGGHYESPPEGGHYESPPEGGHYESPPEGGHYEGGHCEEVATSASAGRSAMSSGTAPRGLPSAS